MSMELDREWLLKAIELSRQCPFTQNAYSVGAIVIGTVNNLISSGFSRDAASYVHAEESAIQKAVEQGYNLNGATIYSSLEPCHPRLSGRTSCADLIIKAGIKRVVFALCEPPVFVVCNGSAHLRENGVEVDIIEELASLVEEINGEIITK